MKYTHRTIKKHKGKLINIEYKTKIGYTNSITGEISASTRNHILFVVNKNSVEISLRYEQIIEISKPKKG